MPYLKYSSISTSSIPIDIKMTILRKGVVGKSSSTFRFMNNEIPIKHAPTIEDRYKTSLQINNEEITIELLDIAGEDDYQKIFDRWINYGDAFFLVFAINAQESFKVLEKKREKILK